MDSLEQAYDLIVQSLGERGYDVEGDENFHATPGRAARGFAQLVLDAEDIEAQVAEMLERTFPSTYDHMILSKHNLTFGLCPHHLLPVIYRISLAYIPSDRVIGISKLSRVARLYSRRPLMQEQLTEDLVPMLARAHGQRGLRGLHRGPAPVHGRPGRRSPRGPPGHLLDARRVSRQPLDSARVP